MCFKNKYRLVGGTGTVLLGTSTVGLQYQKMIFLLFFFKVKVVFFTKIKNLSTGRVIKDIKSVVSFAGLNIVKIQFYNEKYQIGKCF